MSERLKVFVSSVQSEFAPERSALVNFLRQDALMRRFFEVFVFEELPAKDSRPEDVFLSEVERSDIYLGIFGKMYGGSRKSAPSPVEREFDRATELGKTRLIFLDSSPDGKRDPRMRALIKKAEGQVVRDRVADLSELTSSVYASLVEELDRRGKLQKWPLDASGCEGATLRDIDASRLRWFLDVARSERQYSISKTSATRDALTHLNLLRDGRPTNAAILLFGRDPQRFLLSSEVKCMQFHGTEVIKPIPAYQVYKGDVFQLVDLASDFVLSRIDRRVGTRARGSQAPVDYEIPREVVAEAIVNAIAHRDYASNSGVQVMLFSDRLEVWNPGSLPPNWTIADLSRPHASVPRNPLVAEPMYLAHYAERAGTGTMDMIRRCREAGLPLPEFRQTGGQLIQIMARPARQVAPEVTPEVTPEVAPEVTRLVAALTGIMTRQELQRALGLKDNEHFRKAYLQPAMEAGLVAMTIPDKPRSSRQRYRRTRNKPAKDRNN